MTNEIDEVLKFVLYVEEHSDVLTKSQAKDEKEKKAKAAEKIINKWKDRTGKILTPVSLLKKINNIKSRAKSALNSGKPMNEWQKKILELAGAELEVDERHRNDDNTPHNRSNGSMSEAKGVSTGEQILDKYENDETKSLSNEQLQRLIHLKQLQVLNLQLQRLERLNGQDVVFDFVNFDGTSAAANAL